MELQELRLAFPRRLLLLLPLVLCGVCAQVPVPPQPSVLPNPRPVQTTINPVSDLHSIERHHSLHHPLDQSQVYWNFGGSTVLTKKQIRLTPSTQDRRGWLWNEYPLESENWECEFKIEVMSKPHFGGDGMGFWVLHGDQDPAYSTDPEALCGPIFGMRADFNGFGLMFDTYDNDNRRDNPAIFVLRTPDPGQPASPTRFNHDLDFQPDMHQKVVTNVEGVAQSMSKPYTAYRCLAEFRNTGRATKVLVKFLHKTVHVYVDTLDSVGWKFCLAVHMDRSYKDHHIAFSGATGQVADNHDVLEVTTRYLLETDKETNDASMPHADSLSSGTTFTAICYGLATFVGAVVTFLGAYELYAVFQLTRLDTHNAAAMAYNIINKLNTFLTPHWTLHAFLSFLMLLAGGWWGLLFFHIPVLIWRGILLATASHTFNPQLAPSLQQRAHLPRLVLTFALYMLAEFYYIRGLSS